MITVPDKVADVRTVLVLTHGAGGDMNFRHLVSLAQAVAACEHLCVRFTCKSLNLTYRVKAYGAVLVRSRSVPCLLDGSRFVDDTLTERGLLVASVLS